MKPIIFSTPMVQAILDGGKTLTRRILRGTARQNEWIDNLGWDNLIADLEYGRSSGDEWCQLWNRVIGSPLTCVKIPYHVGDVLWVRETWRRDAVGYHYRADFSPGMEETIKPKLKWRPSIHMPREAARLFLRVKNVRVERLQDITEEDAKAEGVICGQGQKRWTARSAFMDLWDRINGKKNPWESNPWVWVIEFEKISKEEAKRLEGMK